MQYHHTDQLGQSVTGARKAAAEALDQLTALDEELAAEREMHRAEKLRLVERAEDAETRASMLVDQLNQALARHGAALARTEELEAELEDAKTAHAAAAQLATDREVDAEEARERVEALEHRVAELMEDADS